MASSIPQVRVGVGVFILRSRQETPGNPSFLIGKRIGSHGTGSYALPGGHLEFGETIEECGAREVLEETGLKVDNLRFLTATNDVMPADNKHYITIFTVCERVDDTVEPQILEPNKCEGWEWASWEDLVKWVKQATEIREGDNLERRLFIPLLNLVNHRPGVVPTNL